MLLQIRELLVLGVKTAHKKRDSGLAHSIKTKWRANFPMFIPFQQMFVSMTLYVQFGQYGISGQSGSKISICHCIFNMNVFCNCNADECLLPKDPGPCEDFSKHYYFNAAKNKCKKFNYGGCGGNENRWKKKGDCRERCKVRRAWLLNSAM